jgi:hypothetical protein
MVGMMKFYKSKSMNKFFISMMMKINNSSSKKGART